MNAPIYQVIALNWAFYKLLDRSAPTCQVIALNWAFYKLLDQFAPTWQVVVWWDAIYSSFYLNLASSESEPGQFYIKRKRSSSWRCQHSGKKNIWKPPSKRFLTILGGRSETELRDSVMFLFFSYSFVTRVIWCGLSTALLRTLGCKLPSCGSWVRFPIYI